MGGGGGTPLGPLLGPRPPMINNILGSDYPDYPDVSKLVMTMKIIFCQKIPEVLNIGEAKKNQ